MAEQGGLAVGAALERADADKARKANEGVVEPVAQGRVLGDDGAAGIDGYEGIDIFERAEGAGRRLDEPHDAAHGKGQLPVTWRLAAPGRAVGHGAATDDAHCGVVVVEQGCAGDVLHPEGGMGALARAAAPHEEIGPAGIIDGGRMERHGATAEHGLGIGYAHERRDYRPDGGGIPTHVGLHGSEVGRGQHAVERAAGDGAKLHEIAAGHAVEAYVAHVVLGLVEQAPDADHRHGRKRPGREAQHGTIWRAPAHDERAERGQERTGIDAGGQADRQGKASHRVEMFCHHLNCPSTSPAIIHNDSLGA